MPKKIYQLHEDKSITADESALAYQTRTRETSFSDEWNPNVPFHGTQLEWWKHFHTIEKGEFMSIEEADKEFEIWRKKFLSSRMK